MNPTYKMNTLLRTDITNRYGGTEYSRKCSRIFDFGHKYLLEKNEYDSRTMQYYHYYLKWEAMQILTDMQYGWLQKSAKVFEQE